MSALLSGVRAHGAVLHRSILEPPWSLRIRERAHLTLALALSGEAWVVFDDGERSVLSPGQVAIFCTQDDYTVADDPGTPVQVVITPSGAELPDGTRLPAPDDPVTCTIDDSGSTVMISGNYVVSSDLSRRLLAPLPRLATVAISRESLLLDFLIDQLATARPGQQAALDRWLDLAMVVSLRAWFETDQRAPGWHTALSDEVVGPALEAIHANPSTPWDVAGLARIGTASRTSFAARFTELVGEPPMTYVTGIRLDLAADLLRRSDVTLHQVARAVGYASPFALSHALKRRTGRRPSELRGRARSASVS
ncbi:MAG: cupin domain-containing protein [Nocardioides sp.]